MLTFATGILRTPHHLARTAYLLRRVYSVPLPLNISPGHLAPAPFHIMILMPLPSDQLLP
jgi:hypothetical protein